MGRLEHVPAVTRWLIFNSVGAMGIAVQLSVLAVLVEVAGLGYLTATGLAVEAAVLHNFCWHERWTWADRVRGGTRGLLRRLCLFHLANGAVSMVGNLILMRLFVGELGMPVLAGNALAIGVCSTLNFLAGDRLVFRTTIPGPGKEDRR